MKDQPGAGDLQFWPQRPADNSHRLPRIQESDTNAAGISTVDWSTEAVTLYNTPLRRRPRHRHRASSPSRSSQRQKADPAITAPASFLPPVERSSPSPSSGQRDGSPHGGIAHEPISGSPRAFDSDAADIIWAKRGETGTILRLDMTAWQKKDHEVAETLAALRKDVLLVTSMSCREQARLWRARRKQMRGGSQALLNKVDLKKPWAPFRRPRLLQKAAMSHQSGDEVDENLKHAAETRKGTLTAKWAAQRARTKSEKEERLHQQQLQGELRAKQREQQRRRELEEQRDKRERVLQWQKEQQKKKGDLYGHGSKPESNPRKLVSPKESCLPPCDQKMSELPMGTAQKKDAEPKATQAEEPKEVAKDHDDEEEADNVAKGQAQDTTEICGNGEENSSTDEEDEESSENEDAAEDFTRQQERLHEQQPSTRLTRFEKRVTQLNKEEKKRTKQLQKEEQELLKLIAEEQEEDAVVPSTTFDVCMSVADKYKVPLKVVQQTLREFHELDVDGNGVLTLDEFEAALRKTTHVGPDEDLPEHLILKTWESIDSNKDNSVDFHEYFLWTLQAGWKEEVLVNDKQERQLRELAREYGVSVVDVEKLKRVFDKFDVDKSGTIDKDEFKAVICSLMKAEDASQVSHSMLNRYWKEADGNNDGLLELQEFMVWHFNFFAR
eukprot:TRINITY_DN1844_c0_g1_i8.p1 TRINITY_DN1844_c0_g1~~TRINITY_DN1844_c0_g1_i8.p1  ORF type:complete len:669 (-),score=184.44 TRINITY_DN1844_c0_g1_i8:244-2250(-)